MLDGLVGVLHSKGRGGLQKGEGDCDSDRDCVGLKCAHDKTNIPGVRNTGAIKWGVIFVTPKDSTLDGTDMLKFLNGSNFDRIIETESNLNH